MFKPQFNKHEVLVFRQFQRKGYALFACLGREVVISVLSVATLEAAGANSISDETWRVRQHQNPCPRGEARRCEYHRLSSPPDRKSGSENGHCTEPRGHCAGASTKY